jgi:HEAT repeat protein
MPITTKKILQLLQREQPVEVRRAAALVLGEVGERDAESAKALCESLQDEEAAVRLQALKSVGKLRVERALPLLLERIEKGGEEADEAAKAAARLGAKGTRALQELMHHVAPGLRRHIAAALAGGGTASAETATVEVLLDKDPGVVEATVRSLIAQIPTFGAAHRRTLTDQLLDLAGKKKTPLPPVSEAAVVRLLAALDEKRAANVFWDRILAPHPPEVRSAALQALSKWATAPDKSQLKRLFTCATDPDFRVAAPALVLLKHLPVSDRSVPEWLSLLQAPDVAARKMAMEQVGDRDTAAVAGALVPLLNDSDRDVRDGALARLAKLEHGRKALTAGLLEADSADRAWPLAKAQAPFARDYPPRWREEVFTRACTHLEAGDRRVDPLLFLLREADAAELRDRLEQRAVYWRKKEEYAKALLYLRLLARDPACGFPIRLELATCGLKVSAKDLTAEARTGDPCLQQFNHLCQQDEAELFAQLEKIKWLDPEDLYYLGFHFAEQQGTQWKFGGKILHLLLKRSPRSKLGQAAKSKLRSAGLDAS